MKLVDVGDICRFEYGKSLSKNNRIPGNFPVYGSNGPVGSHSASCTQGKTIVIGRKGSIGEVHVSCDACWPIDTTYFIDASCTDCDLDWLAYNLKYLNLAELNKASGVPGLNREDAYKKQIWLPETREQQRRIAARLKAQLAEVESARLAAQAQVQDVTLLQRRLLQAAFDGLIGVPVKSLGGWISSYRNGFGKRPAAGEIGPIVLRIADVSSGVIDVSNPRRGVVSAREAETYRLRTNDLLFIRVNGAREIVGRCCVVSSDVPDGTIFNDHLIRVCLKPGIDPEYVRFCAGAPSARVQIEEAASTSAGQLTINQEVIAAIQVPDLGLDAQRRIVARLKSQLAEADALRAALECRQRELDALPQRLLAHAFAS